MAGEKHHGQLVPAPIAPHRATKLRSTDLGHLEIEQDERRPHLIEGVPELKRIGDGRHDEAATSEQCCESLWYRRLVVHHQNLGAADGRVFGPGFFLARRQSRIGTRRFSLRGWVGRTFECGSQGQELLGYHDSVGRSK